MRLREVAIAVLLGSLGSAVASAESETHYRGYLLARSQLFPRNTKAVLYPLLNVEKLQGFLEGNFDLTLKGDRYTVRSDTSALFRVSPSGCRAGSELPGCLVINELYLAYDLVKDHVVVIAGRHRPSWGAALSFHPVEPMNPPPDPTDPTFQRLGAWTAMAELSGEKYVATAGWFPKVSHSALGTPAAIGPGLVGGRFALRPAKFDVSGIFFFDLENRLPQFGASGSTVLGESSFEVHGEALVHQRREIKTGTLKRGTCPVQSLGIPHREEWDYSGIVGARWDHGDGTMVNLEYMHNGDGMVPDDFNAVLATADLLTVMCPDGRLEPADSSEDGRPQQLSSTFLRRNYVILSGLKPTFADEGRLANFGATATVLVALDDVSAVVSARLIYTLKEATVFRLGGLANLGTARSQYGILPFRGMILFDVQHLF
jgi:hypothetical protein